MKKLYTCIVAFTISVIAFVAYGETRPVIELQPVDDAIMKKINEASMFVVPMERDYLSTAFIAENSQKFKKNDLLIIKNMIEGMSDNTLMAVCSTNYKDPTVILIMSAFFGGLGVDRFMLGQVGWGIVKFITAGGWGVWWLIDLFTIYNTTKNVNFKKFKKAYMDAQFLISPTKG